MRREAWLGVMVVGLLAGALPAGVGATAEDTSPWTVEATPTAGLVDGQVITVTGTAPPDSPIGVGLCARRGSFGDRCDNHMSSGTGIESVDASGHWQVELAMRRFLAVDYPLRDHDCARGCRIVLFGNTGEDSLRPVASLPVTFDPDGPMPERPTIAVTPWQGLVDGQEITVTGEGFLPYERLSLHMCGRMARVGRVCDNLLDAGATAAFDGSVDATVSVNSGFVSFEAVDCAARERRCAIHVGTEASRAPRPAGVRFAPDGPNPGDPTLSVTPDSGLVDRQQVAVAITGALYYERLWQCPAGVRVADYRRCGDLGAVGAVGAPGTPPPWNLTVAVWREIVTARSDGTGRRTVDCATAQRPCRIVLGGSIVSPPLASVPIRFDPAVAPVEPSIMVTPDRDLVDGQAVTVETMGFDLVYASPLQCAPRADACRPMEGRVHRFLWDDRGRRIDCADIPRPCRAVATDYYQPNRSASTSLRFAPAPDPPADLELLAAPSGGLADRTPVRVSVEPAPPGRWQVQQCPVDAPSDCRVPRRFAGDTVYIARHLGSVDCAVVPCELRLVIQQITVDTVPLDFDPAAPPPPGPTASAEPTTALVDRQEVQLTVTASEPWIVAQCVAAEPECPRITLNPTARPHPAGETITLATSVRRRWGLVDCAAAPGTCELRVYTDDPAETATIPLTFDAAVPSIPAPRFRIGPRHHLTDGATVSVTATGDVAAIQYVSVRQCVVIDGFIVDASCSSLAFDGNGSPPEGDVSVRRRLEVFGAGSHDCARHHRSCAIVLEALRYGRQALVVIAPLSFRRPD